MTDPEAVAKLRAASKRREEARVALDAAREGVRRAPLKGGEREAAELAKQAAEKEYAAASLAYDEAYRAADPRG